MSVDRMRSLFKAHLQILCIREVANLGPQIEIACDKGDKPEENRLREIRHRLRTLDIDEAVAKATTPEELMALVPSEVPFTIAGIFRPEGNTDGPTIEHVAARQ